MSVKARRVIEAEIPDDRSEFEDPVDGFEAYLYSIADDEAGYLLPILTVELNRAGIVQGKTSRGTFVARWNFPNGNALLLTLSGGELFALARLSNGQCMRNYIPIDMSSDPVSPSAIAGAVAEIKKVVELLNSGSGANQPEVVENKVPGRADHAALVTAKKEWDSLLASNAYLGEVPEIGDPEWGKKTQAERDEWRKKAERYAAEWELELGDRDSGITYETASDEDLARAIRLQSEQREEGFLYHLASDLGYGNDVDGLLKDMRAL